METLSRRHAGLGLPAGPANQINVSDTDLRDCASENDLKAAPGPLGASGQAHIGTLVT